METLLILVLIVLVVGFAVVFWMLKKQGQGPEEGSLVMVQNRISELQDLLDRKISEQYKDHSETIRDVDKKLVKIDEKSKQVVELATQLEDLQDILKNQARRGALGEYFLENALQDVLSSKQFKMQYTFEDGDRADAVVFVGDKIIPIDSKFSLENYKRLLGAKDKDKIEKLEKKLRNDLKKRIDETSKYVKPDEGTTDFALMYIPSEALYYDLLINEVGSIQTRDLIEYATSEKNVVIVAPNVFYAFLQTILQGLNALEIEESAKEIRKRVNDLMRHRTAYEKYLQKLGKHLETVLRSFRDMESEWNKINKDIQRITDQEIDRESIEVKEPKDE